ncbi:MAG: hypothetical protein SOV36_05170 [Anaerostipes faecalis]|nr:hypothetical protein [Anaerostipes faecalis]
MKIIKKIFKGIAVCIVLFFILGLLMPEDDSYTKIKKETTEKSTERYTFTPAVKEGVKPKYNKESNDDGFPDYELLDLSKRYKEGDKVKFNSTIMAIGNYTIGFFNNEDNWYVNCDVPNGLHDTEPFDIVSWLDDREIYEGDNVDICGVITDDTRSGQGGSQRNIRLDLEYVNGEKVITQ